MWIDSFVTCIFVLIPVVYVRPSGRASISPVSPSSCAVCCCCCCIHIKKHSNLSSVLGVLPNVRTHFYIWSADLGGFPHPFNFRVRRLNSYNKASTVTSPPRGWHESPPAPAPIDPAVNLDALIQMSWIDKLLNWVGNGKGKSRHCCTKDRAVIRTPTLIVVASHNSHI